jgi:small subunit ribosomal protein S1
MLGSLKEGAVVKGIVKNITDYGAFVDLGGIDGLLHITDLAWRRVKHPSEVLTVGEEVEAKILKFDQEKNRVSLGIKQLGDDPWVALTRRYPISTRLFGKVTNLTDYGAFVEIEPGIEGLVHVSEMDWTNKNVHPAKIAQLGDEVEVMILEVDEDRRRLSLGMKQCKTNPWDDFAVTHKKNDKVTGQIKSITDFGVFIGLPGGIDGLIHLSDLSWTQTGEEAIRNFKKGDEVTALVLSIDVEKERISLGIKQLESDPSGASTEDKEDKVAKAPAKAKPKKAAEAADAPKKVTDDNAGTTNLGALLKAKLDSKNKG